MTDEKGEDPQWLRSLTTAFAILGATIDRCADMTQKMADQRAKILDAMRGDQDDDE